MRDVKTRRMGRRPEPRAGWPGSLAGAGVGVLAAVGVCAVRRVTAALKVGAGHPFKHRVLDVASALLQPKYPVAAMSTYLNGLHFYADELGRQVEAAHFCIHLDHDLHQCVIFDRNAHDAKLIGIEYIISRERFETLPDDEKRLWHSHHYEVKSGVLAAPGVPELAERAYFEDLVTTYGKTFHTWQYDKHDFPYGAPQLMMGLTDDGQVDPQLLRRRDRRIGVDSGSRRRSRASIRTPDAAPGSYSWESGRVPQTMLQDAVVDR